MAGVKLSVPEKERVRTAILGSAERLFSKHGFAAATTRQIATAAGGATGTVFNYFPTKDDLGLALIRERLASAEKDYLRERRDDQTRAWAFVSELWSCFQDVPIQPTFVG